MVKEFQRHIAWTDAMKTGCRFIGLIEYQRKSPCSMVHVLWVVGPHISGEDEAETAAAMMLSQISEITEYDNVIYSDGVAL